MLTQSTLETSRLILRPLTRADAPSIQTVASICEMADTMISIPHPYPDSEAEHYISKQLAEFEKGHSVTFVPCSPSSRVTPSGCVESWGSLKQLAVVDVSR